MQQYWVDCFENESVFTKNWSVKYWDTDLISSIDTVAPDKKGYPIDIFLISPQEHMLWVRIRNGLMGHF